MSGAIVDASGAIVYAIEKAGRLRLHRGGEVQVSHRGGEVQVSHRGGEVQVSHRGGEVQVSHVYDGERQTRALCGPMREQRRLDIKISNFYVVKCTCGCLHPVSRRCGS
ncbi:hypothetical protein KC19_1G303700 [Ceratodon purpureus]|uniref:Uncharacterized protein n=1 Tax=Ceratodon purpureus TaxID=3225 RepID=A0A8T0JDI2_CERPU|nr:hypothetical protein KC19_1G303700 [Ceratodon purpureus]